MKRYLYLMVILALVTTVAHAQSGCGDSPENPTMILALFGSVGAGLAILRNRRIPRK
jgi:XrtJ-associated TM-motif-TM protein